MKIPKDQERAFLLRLAREEMLRRGLAPDFPQAAIAEVARMDGPAVTKDASVRDLRSLLWCSIDNDESRDLDQLTVAENAGGDQIRILVAIADVSALVAPGSAIDNHAGLNTTSVYTPPQNFPMLPEKLSTDLTSLIGNEDRMAIVIEMQVDTAGNVSESSLYPALVRNRAKLAYSGVAAWLDGKDKMPQPLAGVPGLAENIRLQDRVAQSLKIQRHEHGALALDTIEVRAQFTGNTVSRLSADERNRAHVLIEDFMIASNGVVARFLQSKQFPVMRRVVRSPERWQRIVDLAKQYSESLPPEPDAKALNEFLIKRRTADSLRFPDLSLSVIKLLGRGEYVATFPGQEITGHFGLAVTDYTHSTAPNRRYPDLVTQRLIKAALSKQSVPYDRKSLEDIAARCTEKEDAAEKTERFIRKAAAAVWLEDKIGQEFDGVITGASEKGTWVRVLDPIVEGKVEQGASGLDVGDRVRVKLINTDPEHGFIDFARI